MEQCKVYKKCGGCQLQNLTYEQQLQYKQRKLEGMLSGYAPVQPIVGMEEPTHYRNKVQAAFYWDYKHRRCAAGVFQSTTQKIVPVDSCMIEDVQCDRIVQTVRRLADSFKIKPYDMRYHTGVLRHVLVRRGFATGEIMVVLVTLSSQLPSRNHFVKALCREHPEITTVVQHINPYETNLILGEQSRVLYGKGTIEDVLCGCRFRISPASFYQVNPVQCERLYRAAIDAAQLTGSETLFDAYCGTGTIGIIAAEKAKQVIGVELNRDAVRDAVANARLNGVSNIRFQCGDAGEYLTALAQDGETPDVLLMDPPRAGATVKFLKAVCRLAPEKVVYISCNPVTLARDLDYLTQHSYRAETIRGFDMFPFTKHVETVVLMSRV
ncbi:MAG: 23S rRNA (uracil(1939)-C(5))-methyltransferase RlmD [Eubacterium sp.]|nr:23S rRNA (uracil(1939)-C(5))-methyltransferase RlmD [Eubacterium sp.]